MRKCEIYGWSSSLWDDFQYVHVRQLVVYPYLSEDSNTYLWDSWLFTISLRWCSIRTCETFGCLLSLWHDVPYVHVRHLAVYLLCQMMSNVHMRHLAAYPYLLDNVKCTCETFDCSPSHWDDVQYVHARHLAVYSLFWDDVQYVHVRHWLFTLSLRSYSTRTCETFGCLPSHWDHVQHVHVRHLAVCPLIEMMFNTYM